jgi:hypothetical protein
MEPEQPFYIRWQSCSFYVIGESGQMGCVGRVSSGFLVIRLSRAHAIVVPRLNNSRPLIGAFCLNISFAIEPECNPSHCENYHRDW